MEGFKGDIMENNNDARPKIKFDLSDEAVESIRLKAEASGVAFDVKVKEMLIESMLENSADFGIKEEDKEGFRKMLEEGLSVEVKDSEEKPVSE